MPTVKTLMHRSTTGITICHSLPATTDQLNLALFSILHTTM